MKQESQKNTSAVGTKKKPALKKLRASRGHQRPEINHLKRLTPYKFSKDFPPKCLWGDLGSPSCAVADWYREEFEKVPLPQSDPLLTPRERFLLTRSAQEYASLRRQGEVSCEEFAKVVTRRARHYRRMNQWIYTSYELFEKLIEDAKALDVRAAREGVESLAPFYGLPIPMKGTAAVVDYPSGAGSGVLSGYTPLRDSDLTQLIKKRNGLIFGTTNVPEFAVSYCTANPASGTTCNPYGQALTVGGSSGGAASAVASYMCPLAVSEDTGGSTRVPAACCGNFGFDPSRNHYPNTGNPGITVTNDQLGLIARSVSDIIFYDMALMGTEGLHQTAAAQVSARGLSSIRIGAPLVPFVNTVVPPGLVDSIGHGGLTIEPQLRQKYEVVKESLSAAGVGILNQEWPSAFFEHLGREENVALEALFGGRKVNGKTLDMWSFPQSATLSGQMAQFVDGFLNAPVSIKEIVADMGSTGAAHFPAAFASAHDIPDKFDETQFRYVLGPKVFDDVAAYNSYFESTGADLLLLPVARCATPDYADLVADTLKDAEIGEPRVRADNSVMKCFRLHNFAFKHLHIPKMVVPTGLTKDGRPTAVQIWGPALDYSKMFDDSAALAHDAHFLQLVKKVVEAIQIVPELARQDAPMVKPLLVSHCTFG